MTWLVLTRAVHFAACLYFFGMFAFDRLVAASAGMGERDELSDYWKSRIRWVGPTVLPIVLLSGAVWFALVAAMMSGLPLERAFKLQIWQVVWSQTQFGAVWKLRLIVWLAAAGPAAFFLFFKPKASRQNKLAWAELVLGGFLLGSLAWAGHGQEGARWHLLADVAHLLAAGFWPVGLLPLALLLRKLARVSEPARGRAMAGLVRRFSVLSLASVSGLTITGWINGWFLVGSFDNLFQQPYGRWLLAKIMLFAFAVGIGAVNLLRLKPRLQAESFPAASTAARLRFNVWLELFFGTLVIVIVAVLGILPPAVR